MKPKEFERKVIKVVKAMRILNNKKQINLANALGMTEGNYCKLEHGERAICISQLKVIAEYFQTSYLQILLIAEGEDQMHFKLNPLSKLLIDYVLLLEKRGEEIGFKKDELDFIILKIREHYS